MTSKVLEVRDRIHSDSTVSAPPCVVNLCPPELQDTPQVSFPDGSRFDYGVWVNETCVKFGADAKHPSEPLRFLVFGPLIVRGTV
ncbi:hypothetical protein PSHT_12951 [Puccinia striiformis]|uniref:Uncharacterized protein n=1 Tax=Puccinia striiformis TaxID=27350 RepID=A0A2S4UTD7_9BASI|nr:hypothetical protein PSHT_12951 [Puccinia striiformis]